MDLFYDDGEYFNNTRIPVEGTLSGWVIQNDRELFLPDLRANVQLEGVRDVVVGKDKTSLAWMGVPLKASNVKGIIALGSYKPNAFDSGDMSCSPILLNMSHLPWITRFAMPRWRSRPAWIA